MALELPIDSHPALFNLEEPESLTYPGGLLYKTQNPPFRVLFLRKFQLLNPVGVELTNGASRPFSRRNARVQRPASSRLCVTRIEVSP